jgi:hypothetical protein
MPITDQITASIDDINYTRVFLPGGLAYGD